jgi:hypothetical protein
MSNEIDDDDDEDDDDCFINMGSGDVCFSPFF